MSEQQHNLTQLYGRLHLTNGEIITRGDPWITRPDDGNGKDTTVGIVGLMFYVPGRTEDTDLGGADAGEEPAKESDAEYEDLVELTFPAHFVVWLHGSKEEWSYRRIVPMTSVLYAEQQVPTEWARAVIRDQLQLGTVPQVAQKAEVVEQ